MDLLLRGERPDDRAAVFEVNSAAFGRPGEAKLVDALRLACPEHLSLVAEENGRVVGHVLFTPVNIVGCSSSGVGLGPVAVLPGRQRSGIGAALIHEGLRQLRDAAGCGYVVVLGDPAYYSRFGFVSSARFDLRCKWEVPEGAFQVLELQPNSLDGCRGTVQYHRTFDSVT